MNDCPEGDGATTVVPGNRENLSLLFSCSSCPAPPVSRLRATARHSDGNHMTVPAIALADKSNVRRRRELETEEPLEPEVVADGKVKLEHHGHPKVRLTIVQAKL